MRLLTLRSVLVATDLTAASRPALETAARVAPLAGAELHLLHVAEAPRTDVRMRVRDHLRQLAPGAPEPASEHVAVGVPAEEIVRYAAEVHADVVILGPHRRGGAGGGEMGSTAASVVADAPCPCLVAATVLRLPLQRVVAPIDLSEAARGALSVAVTWASALRPRETEARLTALHVAPTGVEEDAEGAVREEVRQSRSLAGDAARVEILERVVPAPDPAREILRVAAEGPADLLVLATRRETGADPRLGSVSAAVARATPCPLLLVPPATWRRYRDA
jgi:nucleotide-binding universal stress UspA family protein